MPQEQLAEADRIRQQEAEQAAAVLAEKEVGWMGEWVGRWVGERVS